MRFLCTFAAILFCLSANVAQQTDHVLGELLIQLAPETHPRQLERALSTFEGRATGFQWVKAVSPPMRIHLYRFDYGQIHERRFLEYVRNIKGVQIAQFNHLIEPRTTTPDDPQFPLQWQYINDGSGGGVPDADLDAELAWDITTGGLTPQGDTIVVCVIDGGIDMGHEDFGDNLWYNWAEIPGNGIDDDNNGYVDDFRGWNAYTETDEVDNDDWHGTNVAGIVGAQGDNGIGVAGVNWNVKVMVVVGGGNEAEALAAYTYPWVMRKRYNETDRSEGAFVVATNASWGIDYGQPADAPLWCAFYDSLGMQGILNCGATANNDVNVDEEGDLPTACPSDFLISVTNMNNEDVKVTGAGYGATTIDLGAFGTATWTAQPGDTYGAFGGTSGATPHVTGTVALLYAAPCPLLGELALTDPPQAALLARQYILDGVDPNASLAGITVTGGRLNMFNSLQLLMQNCGPCPPPAALVATDILDTAALISWHPLDSTLFVNLRWRQVGDTVWQIADSLSADSLLLSGLQACTSYEVEVEAVCADTLSGFIPHIEFTTDGCCVPPEVVFVDEVDTTVVVAHWPPVLAAQHYIVTVAGTTDTLVLDSIEGPELVIEGLMPCTDYQIQVQTVCDTGITQPTPPFDFRTFGCGPCIDLTYCEAGASTQFEFIQSVLIDTFANTSGDNGGYAFFGDSLNILLHTYGLYDVTLEPGYQDGSYGEHFRVWIDFNQDGDFDDDGEMVFETAEPAQEPVTFTLLLGPDVPTGLTRMRVGMTWAGNGGTNWPDACGVEFEGEFEDYCLTIVEGTPPECLAPELVVDTAGYEWVHLVWDDNPEANNYFVQIRPQGSDEWHTEDTHDPEFWFEQLEPCTTYELRLAAHCIGVAGDYGDIVTFTTACPPPCDGIVQAVDTANVGYTSLLLFWEAQPNAEGYVLLYRPQGTDDWHDALAASAEIGLAGLEPCTTYDLLIKTLCSFGESDFSDTLSFMTACPPPCDSVPHAIDTVNVTEHSMVLYWNEIAHATGYVLLWKEHGTDDWHELDTPQAEVHLNELEPCTAYDIKVKVLCDFGESPFTQVFTFMTACPSATDDPVARMLGIEAQPNPFADRFTLSLELPQNATLDLRLLHVSGQVVATRRLHLPQGAHTLVWDEAATLPAGVYLLEVASPWGRTALRMVRMR